METKLLGRWGEATAADYLRKKRYIITATGYRTRLGEIDLIAENRRYIVFVEVKLRGAKTVARPAEFVDISKRRKIIATAKCYLSQNETALQPRFDVIEIYAPDGTQTDKPVIRHIENAFGEDE